MARSKQNGLAMSYVVITNLRLPGDAPRNTCFKVNKTRLTNDLGLFLLAFFASGLFLLLRHWSETKYLILSSFN